MGSPRLRLASKCMRMRSASRGVRVHTADVSGKGLLARLGRDLWARALWVEEGVGGSDYQGEVHYKREEREMLKA